MYRGTRVQIREIAMKLVFLFTIWLVPWGAISIWLCSTNRPVAGVLLGICFALGQGFLLALCNSASDNHHDIR